MRAQPWVRRVAHLLLMTATAVDAAVNGCTDTLWTSRYGMYRSLLDAQLRGF